MADASVEYEEPSVEEKLASIGGESIDILLSKEANKEQLDIARRIERCNAVLVQGPPGTGKTHTIANLVGHFLAQGKSVLVTSHTRKALSVLKEKVPEGLQSLCVSVLDDTNVDMERSVDGITGYISRHNSAELKQEAERAAKKRELIIRELADTRRAIFQALHKEYESIVYQGKGYSPLEAAEFVSNRSADLAELIPGPVEHVVPMPLATSELEVLYKSNETVAESDEKEIALGMPDPASIPDSKEFIRLVQKLRESEASIDSICARHSWELSENGKEGSYVVARPKAKRLTLELGSEEDINALRNYAASHGGVDEWRVKAAADGRKGGAYLLRWEALFEQIEKTREISERLIVSSLGKIVELSDELDREAACDDLDKMGKIFAQKGKIGRIDQIVNRGFSAILEQVAVNGAPVSSSEDCALVIDQISLDIEREKSRALWRHLMSDNGAPEFDELGSREPERIASKWIEDAKRLLGWYSTEHERYRKLLAQAGFQEDSLLTSDPLDTEENNIRRMLDVMMNDVPDLCNLATALLIKSHALAEFDRSQAILHDGRRNESNICMSLSEAIRTCDSECYTIRYSQLRNLHSKQELVRKRAALLSKLQEFAPKWANAISVRDGLHGLQNPPDKIEEAWKWKQLNAALEDIGATSLSELQQRSFDLGREYRRTTAELAEKRAWLALLMHTERDISLKQSLQGWKQTVKKIGKGTGKKAPMMKAHARSLMSQCQNAVPVWIMPMGRALESLDPETNRFDVVIVDEASQSDVSALAITYLAKKVIIVGDDKQVSPMAVGVEDDKSTALADMYIKDVIPNYHLYGPRTSLYDIAKTTFQELMLKEHFRCIPEIIGFSNMLSYDFKIKPLRDPGSSNLVPPVIAHRVQRGERSGKTNRREAEEIICLIKSCMEQPEYDGKTFVSGN